MCEGDNQIGDYDYYIYDNPRLNPRAVPADPLSLAKLKEEKQAKVSTNLKGTVAQET